MGYAHGAKAIDEANPDKAIFPEVDTSAVYGHMHPVRMRMPIFTGALGSTDIARKHWDGLAAAQGSFFGCWMRSLMAVDSLFWTGEREASSTWILMAPTVPQFT